MGTSEGIVSEEDNIKKVKNNAQNGKKYLQIICKSSTNKGHSLEYKRKPQATIKTKTMNIWAKDLNHNYLEKITMAYKHIKKMFNIISHQGNTNKT